MCNDILDGHEEIDFIEAQSAEEVDDVEESVEEEQEEFLCRVITVVC